MSDAGRKIIDGLKDALAGNFSAVTIEGQRWVRSDEITRLRTALARIASPVQHVEGVGMEHAVNTIERLREIAREALGELK